MKSYPNKNTTPPGGFPYTQPETGVVFQFNTWHEIVLYVGRHRRGMSLDLADGWELRLEHDFCEQNPHIDCVDDSVPPTLETPLMIQGRAMWRELHAYTEAYPEQPTAEDIVAAQRWMGDWNERIPRYGCNCRSDWGRLLANFPPRYESREAFVTWARQAHDAINRKIGKALWDERLFAMANLGGF